jgi:hypothetical protein
MTRCQRFQVPDSDEAAAIAVATGDGLVQAWVPFFRGTLRGLAGDFESARRSFEEATELVRDVGDEWCSAQAIVNLVYMCLLLGDYPSARKHLRSVLTVLLEHPDWVAVPSVIRHVAQLAAHTGRPAEVLRLVAASRRLRDEMGAVGQTGESSATVRAASASRKVRVLIEVPTRVFIP